MSNKLEELDLLMPFDPQELPVEAVQQKHFTEPNGMLHTSYKDDQCLCSHRKSQHLFCDDVCLVAKPTICICDGFKNKNKSVATSSWEDQSKFRKWKKQQTKNKSKKGHTRRQPPQNIYNLHYYTRNILLYR